MSEKEIGARTISEVVYFNVTDPGGNKLPMQMFSISITPVNNQPPVATVGPGIQVSLCFVYVAFMCLVYR